MLPYILVVVFPLLVGGLYNKRVKENNLLKEEVYNKKVRWRYILFAALPMFFLIGTKD